MEMLVKQEFDQKQKCWAKFNFDLSHVSWKTTNLHIILKGSKTCAQTFMAIQWSVQSAVPIQVADVEIIHRKSQTFNLLVSRYFTKHQKLYGDPKDERSGVTKSLGFILWTLQPSYKRHGI